MSSENSAAGYSYALAAYLFWGVAPVYFVLVGFAMPLEILANRIIWSIPLLALLVVLGRQYKALAGLSLRTWLLLGVCSVLLSLNWLTFIYGISTGRIAETSLGYFMNPLVTIALGTLVLGERMRIWQWVAVSIAALGLSFEFANLGTLPWVALTLAITFGLYGLIRKQLLVPAGLGLGIETIYLLPFALAFLWLGEHPVRGSQEQLLLAFGGIITVVPLVWFGAAASRLKLSTLGFIQYLAPTLSLIIAVYVYNEAVSNNRWVSFGLVWLSILLYSAEGLWWQNRTKAH